jgi:hypothetical protein
MKGNDRNRRRAAEGMENDEIRRSVEEANDLNRRNPTPPDHWYNGRPERSWYTVDGRRLTPDEYNDE